MKNLLTLAVAAAVLTACTSDPEPAPEPAAPTTAVAFDDAQIQSHVGVVGPGEFGPNGVEYWYDTPDGVGCPVAEILSDPGEVDMAGPAHATNPDRTAGVELYDSPHKATCLEALTEALVDFPTGG